MSIKFKSVSAYLPLTKLLALLFAILITQNSAFATCNPNTTRVTFTPNTTIPLGNQYAHIVNYTLSLPDGCGFSGAYRFSYGYFQLYDPNGNPVQPVYYLGSDQIYSGTSQVYISKKAFVNNVDTPLQPGTYNLVAHISYGYTNSDNVRSQYVRQFSYSVIIGSTTPAQPTTPPVVTNPPVITPVVPFVEPYAKVAITNITEGQIVSGIIPVNFTVSNIRSFDIRGVDISPYTAVLAGSIRSIELDTRQMPEGRRSIAVRIIGLDMRGQTAYFFGNVTLDVRNGTTKTPTPPQNTNPLPGEDRTFPGISINGLDNNQVVSGILKFSVTASDNIGLKSLEVFAFGSKLFSREFANFPAESLLYSQNFLIDTSKYPNGTYEVNVTAVDKNSIGRNPNGNPASSVRIFTVNNSGVSNPGNPEVTPAPEVTPGNNNPPVVTPAPQPQNPGADTLGALINMLSQLMAQLTELLKELLKTAAPTATQAKIAKSMANSLSELASTNKEQFESMEQTKNLPSQAKNMKKSINKALKQAQKKNDMSAMKAAQKEINKANRQIKKVVESLK